MGVEKCRGKVGLSENILVKKRFKNENLTTFPLIYNTLYFSKAYGQ